MKRNRRVDVVIWLVLVLGLVTTALGVAYGLAATPGAAVAAVMQNSLGAAIISSLGAGIVGAAMSIVVARAVDRPGAEELSAVVARSLTARFVSTAEELAVIRGDWHHYHVTSIGGRTVWRYTRQRLDRPSEINSLQTHFDITDQHGAKHAYEVEAGVRGTKGILLMRAARGGASSEVIEVIPGLTRAFQLVHYGIGLYETWDGTNVVGKIILSRRPLVPATKAGVVDESHFAQLDRMWHDGFRATHQILPDASLRDPAPS